MFCIRAETNTQVLVKDFGTRIVKLILKYSLRLHDPAHMMYLQSGSDAMKAIEFDWHNFLLGTLTSVYFNTVCVLLLLLEKAVNCSKSVHKTCHMV